MQISVLFDGKITTSDGWEEESFYPPSYMSIFTRSEVMREHAREAQCSIQLENYVVITGGYTYIDEKDDFLSSVKICDDAGVCSGYPPLIVARFAHGCGYYYDNSNNLVS